MYGFYLHKNAIYFGELVFWVTFPSIAATSHPPQPLAHDIFVFITFFLRSSHLVRTPNMKMVCNIVLDIYGITDGLNRVSIVSAMCNIIMHKYKQIYCNNVHIKLHLTTCIHAEL